MTRAIRISAFSVRESPNCTIGLAMPISVGGWGVGEAIYNTVFGFMGQDGIGANVAVLFHLGILVVSLSGLPFYIAGKRAAAEKTRPKRDRAAYMRDRRAEAKRTKEGAER